MADLDQNSLLLGVLLGVFVGISIGYILSHKNVAPTISLQQLKKYGVTT